MDIDSSYRGSPMDIDTSKSNSKSKLSFANAVVAYDTILYRVFKNKTATQITQRDVLFHFHPDKMPKMIKEFSRISVEFRSFVNHMFDDLRKQKTNVQMEDVLVILEKNAKADLNM